VSAERQCIPVTKPLVNSLSDGQWLSSSALDLFVRHLEKSYYDNSSVKKDVKFFKVEDFEKMIPSMKVEWAATE
jgi:hypothetical protein